MPRHENAERAARAARAANGAEQPAELVPDEEPRLASAEASRPARAPDDDVVVELAPPDVPLSKQTDRQLLYGLRAGSEAHFGELYNRYFNVKFVSLDGDYSTCSQVCPVKDKVILDMRQELLDKEIGLLQISNDKTGYYRADLLLKESELVLQATCQACSAGRS